MTTADKKNRLRRKVSLLVEDLRKPQNGQAVDLFVELLEDIENEINELREEKVSNTDIKLLIQQMQAGFDEMRLRFENIDKRFEDVDKRLVSIDKRFESMDKRFEFIEKRFEAMDRRFTAVQWAIGLGFTVLSFLMAILSYLNRVR